MELRLVEDAALELPSVSCRAHPSLPPFPLNIHSLPSQRRAFPLSSSHGVLLEYDLQSS